MICVLGQSFAHSESQFPQESTKQSSSSSSAYLLISDLWLMVPYVHFVHWTLDPRITPWGFRPLNYNELTFAPFLNPRQAKPLDVSSCDG